MQVEHAWVGADSRAPLIVFLHEGLGSLAMWKDFPAQLCAAVGARGLVYSRPGYGRSTPRPPDERWAPDFLHRQAHEVLPALLEALHVDLAAQPTWLLGHSDGGSIALLHAARFSAQLAGVLVMAPHIVVEEISVASIEQARAGLHAGATCASAWRSTTTTPIRPSAAGTTSGWTRPSAAGTSPARSAASAARCWPCRAWTTNTARWSRSAASRGSVPQTQLLELPACGHSPHRDQPAAVITAARAFMAAGARG